MKNLLYKELTFTINKFFYVLPLLLSCLFFIPQWFFSIVLMYFFWISMTNIYAAYTSQQDYHFMSILPVSRKDIVAVKVYAIVIIELLHLILAVIFGIVHNLIYGSFNFGMDINPAFFGIMFMTFGLFNIIFLPLYFKTAYKYGLPVILGNIAILIFVVFFELNAFKNLFLLKYMESSNQVIQYSVLLVGVLLFIIANTISLKKSIKNFELIN